ncbi:MAG: hypothetical protein ABWK04_09300 [Hydrogenobacter sp.]
MERRTFLKLLLGMLAGSLSGCGGGGGSNSQQPNLPKPPPSQEPKRIKFGLGNDPERMINAYDPDGKRVLDAIQPDIVCMWINGARDYLGRLYTPSMDYIRSWAQKDRFAQWSQMGYELMVITWENYDGQNSALGLPTYGEWHISEQFFADLEEFLGYLRSQFKNKLYFALATEQSTYTACRYDTACSNPQAYSDRINSITEEYFSKLRDSLLKALRIIRNTFPLSDFGVCFGGWLVEFEEGINFVKYFEPVIYESNAVFFQSMMGKKASENNGYGNPERILKNCQFYSLYGKPIHLAHYMPQNKRTDVISDDAQRMSDHDYLKTIANYLSSFSFMDYGVLKANEFDCLTKMVSFRQLLKAIL